MKSSQENPLLGIFSTKNPMAHLLKLIDNKPLLAPECNDAVIKRLSDCTKQALANGHLRREDMEKLSIVLKTISLVASYEEEPKGLTQLLDKGLTHMINILEATLNSENDLADSGNGKFLDDILEVIGGVSDYSSKAKSHVVETFCNKMMQMVTSMNIPFTTKMETLKTINVILEGCPLHAREQMQSSPGHKDLIQRLCSLIFSMGDYEFQVGIIEALFRLTNKADRTAFAKDCFRNKDCVEAFFRIRDSEFETDCRKFLNILNEKNSQKSRVVSIPCQKAWLGDYELVKPADASYSKFWVDFNTGSKRISVFCNPENSPSQEEEEGMWETVSVWQDNVLNYTCKDIGSRTEVRIQLRCRARDLIGFGPQFSGNTVSLSFDSRADISSALDSTLRPAPVQQKPARKVSQAIDSLKRSGGAPSAERVESPQYIATAAVTPGKRPHVSVPCQPMTTLPSHAQPAKLSRPDVAMPSRQKSPKPPVTPTTKTRCKKRVKTPLQLISSGRSDEQALSTTESPIGRPLSQPKARKVSVGRSAGVLETSTRDKCIAPSNSPSKIEETEIVIPSSVPETVICDSLPPVTDLRDGLSDAETKKDQWQLDKRHSRNIDTGSLDIPSFVPLKSSSSDEVIDVYMKDTLRASLPPYLSTVSEEGSTPSTRGKSAKLAAERGRVDKTNTSVEKASSKTRAVAGITMMSPDSTSQNTLVASYVHQEGACGKKRKKKRRKKASRVRPKKAGVARWNAPTRGGSVSSQEDSVGAELECLSPKETADTMDLSDEVFKPEAKQLSRKEIMDLYDADFKVKAKVHGRKDVHDKKRDVVKLKSQKMRRDNRVQGRRGAKDVDISDEGICKDGKKEDVVGSMRADNRLDISDEGINECYVADKDYIGKLETTQLITNSRHKERMGSVSKTVDSSDDVYSFEPTNVDKKRHTTSKKVDRNGDERVTEDELTNKDHKKPKSGSVSEKQKQKLKETESKKPQRGRKKSHDTATIENKRSKSEDLPNDRKAKKGDVYCFDDEAVDTYLEDDTAIQIDVPGSAGSRSRHNFGSQISDYDAESQDANLIHRDEIADNVQSQQSAAYSQDVSEVERSTPLKRTEKEHKQDSKRTKNTTQPRVTEKVDYPIEFEDFAKTGVRSRKHTTDRSVDRQDKKRNKQGTMEALCKKARIRRSPDISLPAYDMFGSQVKQPKFFKSRHKERTGNVEKTVESSDDVYSFEPTTGDKKTNATSKKADRNGNDVVTDDDELICGSESSKKITKSFSDNSLHKHANKPWKQPPKDNKSKKGYKHSDTRHEEQRESKYESAPEDKPKHKLKCLSTLRERIHTSVLYDFEDAVATSFGFDDDDEEGEHASRSVRIIPTEDTKKKRNSEYAAKENSKKKGNSEYAMKENTKKKVNSEYAMIENTKKKVNSEYAVKENTKKKVNSEYAVKENTKKKVNSEYAVKENTKKKVNSEYAVKENTKKKVNSEYAMKENTKKKVNSEYAMKENETFVEGKMKRKAQEDSKAAKISSLKLKAETENNQESDNFVQASMDVACDNSGVEDVTSIDIPDFGQMCRGLSEDSEYNFRSDNRHPSKIVNYKDISDSEIDVTPFVRAISEQASSEHRHPASKKHHDSHRFTAQYDVKAPVRKTCKRSVFSETDEGAETRSEVSWLGSTARKGKPRPARTYRNRAGKTTVYTDAGRDSEGNQSDYDEHVPVAPKQPKRVTNKRKKVHSPRLSEDENSHIEPLYYRPNNKKSTADKENIHSELTRPSKDTHHKTDFFSAFKSSLQRLNMSSVNVPTTPKTPASVKGSHKGRWYQSMTMDINKTMATPGSIVDVSVEEFRFENVEVTPAAMALDSPIMLQREEPDEVSTPESSAENVDVVSRTTSTPRSHRISDNYHKGFKHTTPANNKKGSHLSKALGDVMKSGPYTAASEKSRRQKRHTQYAYYTDDEKDEIRDDEDIDERMSSPPVETTIRPRKLFHDNDTAQDGTLDVPRKEHVDMTQEIPEEDEEEEEEMAEEDEEEEEEMAEEDEEEEEEMSEEEEEGMTSISEIGTSVTGEFDMGMGMNIASLGKSFGAELQRNMLARKQGVDQLTRHALKVTQRQVTSFWSQQNMSRKQILSEFRKNLLQEVHSLEKDCSRCNEAEETVFACVKQQQQVTVNSRQSQDKRLQHLREMQDEFMRALRSLDAKERGQLGTIRETMRAEMQALQKKLLYQSQQQEMNQVKRAMQTLFM